MVKVRLLCNNCNPFYHCKLECRDRKHQELLIENHALQGQVQALQAKVKELEQLSSTIERSNKLTQTASMPLLNEAYETDCCDLSDSTKDKKSTNTSSASLPQAQSTHEAAQQTRSFSPPPKLIRELSSFPFAPPLPPKAHTQTLSQSASTQKQTQSVHAPLALTTQKQNRDSARNVATTPNHLSLPIHNHLHISTHALYSAQMPVLSTTPATEFGMWLTQRWFEPAIPHAFSD